MEDNGKNRVVRWTQKLLDLSLRNRLLNARDSKQILPLAVDDVASLEDRLSADQSVAVEPSDSQSRSAGALRSTLAADDMLRRLKEIFRLAKTDLEESGVNALYLALRMCSQNLFYKSHNLHLLINNLSHSILNYYIRKTIIFQYKF